MFNTKYVDSFAEFYANHKKFIEARYAEAKELCASNRELKLDIELYQQLIDTNIITVLEMYEDKDFIGYCTVLISPAILSKGKIDAKIDHIALGEEYRDKGYASLMLAEVETLLKHQGVDELSIVLPPTEQHGKFAEAKGYEKNIIMYTKPLEGGY